MKKLLSIFCLVAIMSSCAHAIESDISSGDLSLYQKGISSDFEYYDMERLIVCLDIANKFENKTTKTSIIRRLNYIVKSTRNKTIDCYLQTVELTKQQRDAIAQAVLLQDNEFRQQYFDTKITGLVSSFDQNEHDKEVVWSEPTAQTNFKQSHIPTAISQALGGKYIRDIKDIVSTECMSGFVYGISYTDDGKFCYVSLYNIQEKKSTLLLVDMETKSIVWKKYSQLTVKFVTWKNDIPSSALKIVFERSHSVIKGPAQQQAALTINIEEVIKQPSLKQLMDFAADINDKSSNENKKSVEKFVFGPEYTQGSYSKFRVMSNRALVAGFVGIETSSVLKLRAMRYGLLTLGLGYLAYKTGMTNYGKQLLFRQS